MDLSVKIENIKDRLSNEAYEYLKVWSTDKNFKDFVPELAELLESPDIAAIEDSFYKHIEIGTGGIRGPIGVGPNRINLQTIGEAAQGLANFIEDFGSGAKLRGVVVGYEARKLSKPFAELCCRVFAASGIKSYLFDGLRATPEISFAVRHLGALAGVMLTASHNPRTDNGFKFYWLDGGQVVPPVDQKFMEFVKNVSEIKKASFEEALKSGMVTIVGKEVDEAYFEAVRKLTLVKNRSAGIVFSPIHGVGITNVLPILNQEGFKVTVVPEQAEPDENFPTAVGDLINPEYKEVMSLPIALGEKLGADLAICSDPDADRIGVAAKIALVKNEMQFLTGNEVGVAMCHFILSRLKDSGRLRPQNLVIETYVTTSLIGAIAKDFGVRVIDDLLVGFKFIGEIIEKLGNKDDFVFAAEESLGYLRGTFVRDKDAAIAALTLAELVSWLADSGKTLIDYLDEIYEKYGYFKNILHMQEMRGKIGFLNIGSVMRGLRDRAPEKLAGFRVLGVIDRLPTEKAAPDKYKTGTTGDQLTFVLSGDELTRVTVRPSGTEPKIKYYIQVYAGVSGNLDQVKRTTDETARLLEDSILAEAEKYIQRNG
ncbi:phospho-sugar mutase [Candidatus Curtissbacteria bacterium]|nr:phospho-sugar mutase [Candidatus Curtissbacteria bacterium]